MHSTEAPLWERYVELVLDGDATGAVQLVLDPVVTGELDIAQLFEEVLTPAAERVGQLWYDSEITVADEHFATQLNQQVIATAVAVAVRPPVSKDVVVLACPPGEVHDTGLRMIAALLGASGFVTHLLGASTPIRDLVSYAQKAKATHVGISVATALSIPGAVDAIAALRAALPAVGLFVGGRAASKYATIGEALGVTTCTNADEALAYLAARG